MFRHFFKSPFATSSAFKKCLSPWTQTFQSITKSECSASGVGAYLRPNHVFHFNQRLFSVSPVKTHSNIMWAKQQFAKQDPESALLALHSDIAGTLVDVFCRLPLTVFYHVFEKRGMKLTVEDVTDPMGNEKKEHIRKLLRKLKDVFFKLYQRDFTEEDVQAIFNEFETMILEKVGCKEYTDLTPHTLEVFNFLTKELGLLITTTSGYPEKVASLAISEFAKLFAIKASTAGGERMQMLAENMKKSGIPLRLSYRTLFITDAEPDIASVRSVADPSHMPWIVAIAGYSTHVGIMSLAHLNSLSSIERASKQKKAHDKLQNAHIIIDDMSELALAMVAIQKAIEQGLRPATTKKLLLVYPREDLAQDYYRSPLRLR